jgi:putative salt-induced outer membrane protein YdiY
LERLRDYKAPEEWSSNLRLGVNLSTGDSKWTETFIRANLVVDPPQSRNFYRYGGSYTLRETEKNDGSTVVSTDRYDANFTYRRDVSEAWFLQNSIGGRADRVKGIDRELQELVGLGYRLTTSDKLEVLVGGGGGVEDFQTQTIDTRTGINPVANVFQELTWRPFEKASLVQEFNYFVNPDDAGQFNYLLRASFRYRITDLLGIEFSFDKNFDNDVGNGRAQDDTRVRNAVIVYF